MPSRKPHATPARILTAAADHIERVGLYQGDHLWQPGRVGDTAPCTVLYAWERGVRSVRPRRSVRGEPWDIFQRAISDSLVALSDHLNGRPVSDFWKRLMLTEDAYRRSLLWCWGDEPGRTTVEAAATIRAAAALCPSGDERGTKGCPIRLNMV
ncbi:DUF6197 family protein [Streptomyces olivaceus]|uniref:DUF6197 family protein n=1 Tax=Streptomyces olivaceus TaxID=47716 RepID=UPI0036E1D69E